MEQHCLTSVHMTVLSKLRKLNLSLVVCLVKERSAGTFHREELSSIN